MSLSHTDSLSNTHVANNLRALKGTRDLWVTSPTLYPLGHDSHGAFHFLEFSVVNLCFFFSWGQWTEIKWCPSGFLTAFQLRVESSQGIEDDTAANNIRFNCSGGSLLQGEGTYWGEWGNWSPLCQGRGICGIMTRIDEPQGIGDDTALNDVCMFCCD
uniref:Vitelline membrane outer layer 1 homolog a n=1 Tax=Sinocyclocheilus anshuiensis TaxID=1608454 RepID=A0A671KJ80_9TELE